MALTLCVNLCPAWAMAEESTSGTYMHYPEHTQDYSHMEERHSMEAEYSMEEGHSTEAEHSMEERHSMEEGHSTEAGHSDAAAEESLGTFVCETYESETDETLKVNTDNQNENETTDEDYQNSETENENETTDEDSKNPETENELKKTDASSSDYKEKDAAEDAEDAEKNTDQPEDTCGNTESEQKCSFDENGNCPCGAKLEVTLPADLNLTYNGKPQCPDITVYADGQTELTPGQDYKIDYDDNTNAGTATANVTGITFDGTVKKSFRINPAPLSITADDQTITYGENIKMDKQYVTSEGLCNGHMLSDITLTASSSQVAAKNKTIKPSDAKILAGTGEDVTANYQITYEHGALTINKAALTVTDAFTTVRDYQEGNTNAEVGGVFFDGLKNGDTLVIGTDYTATGTFETADAGDGKPVTVTVSLSDTDKAGNYDLTVGTVQTTGNIMKARWQDVLITNLPAFVIYGDPCTLTIGDGAEYSVSGPAVMDSSGNVTFTGIGEVAITVTKPEDDNHIFTQERTSCGVGQRVLTIIGATAENKAYDGSCDVKITGMTLDGIVGDDQVSVNTEGRFGQLGSNRVGTYTEVTVYFYYGKPPELIGAQSGNYTLSYDNMGKYKTNVEITRQGAEITVGTDSYHKTFGDPAFTLDVTDNNIDADVQYEVTEGTDVVSVSEDGTVTILNAGQAVITASLPETADYNAAEDKTITVSVAQNGEYSIDDIYRTYPYTRENADSISLAALLPADCGTAVYEMQAQTGTAAYIREPIIADGNLSYTLDKGNIDDEGTITVTIKTRNYKDITAAIHIKLTDQISVSLKDGAQVTLKKQTLTYGEPLSVLEFQETEFVGSDQKAVTGTLAWKNPTMIPEAGTIDAVWLFTPDDPAYAALEGTVSVTITSSSCIHTAGGILYTGSGEKAPGCTENGLGHTECTKCHIIMETGITVSALGHDYNTGEVTKEPTELEEGEKTYTCMRCGHTYTEEIPRKTPTVETHEGLWLSGLVQSVPYTGNAVTQENIIVYYDSTPLRENADYRISYKNNTNAGTAQVIVTGKGNYTQKAVKTFTIEPIDISADSGMTATVTTATETGGKLKPAVTVTWHGKRLKEKTDYTLSYNTDIRTAGTYDITLTGTRNFKGVLTRAFHVKPRGTKLLNSAKVTGAAKSYPYQDSRLASDLQNLTVRIGKTTLERGTHYTVRTENTEAVGTGAIIIEAAPGSIYAGEKRIAVAITGIDLGKGSIKGVEKSYPYTGKPVTPQITVYSGRNGTGKALPADAYTISYSRNINKGKAAVTATGIPQKGYIGSITLSYQIGTVNLAAEKNAGNIKVTIPTGINHVKGGAKPQPVITYTCSGTTTTLREGTDYTLRYSNNMTAAGTTVPTVKITGTGNYSGSITEQFTISAQDIRRLSITVTDKAYGRNKKGKQYYSAPKVYDLDGKQLKSGKDYTVQYTYADSKEPIGRNDKIPAGTKLCAVITATPRSSYTGTADASYFVREAREVKDIAKVKNDKIPTQQYTGSAVVPEIRLYMRNGQTKTYLTSADYEIIGCYNNTKRGTAVLLIRGTGSYSGVKRITFKIAPKRFQ